MRTSDISDGSTASLICVIIHINLPVELQMDYYFCRPAGVLSNAVLTNLCFVRDLIRISASVHKNVGNCRWPGSYRTVAKATADGSMHTSCRNTYLWTSTVSVAPCNVHAPQKPNVSRCSIETTNSTSLSRTPTASTTLPRNYLKTAWGKFLIVTDQL